MERHPNEKDLDQQCADAIACDDVREERARRKQANAKLDEIGEFDQAQNQLQHTGAG